jgi:hypothetical protein
MTPFTKINKDYNAANIEIGLYSKIIIENMKCCGNCKKEIDCDLLTKSNYCEEWQYDGLKQGQRLINK